MVTHFLLTALILGEVAFLLDLGSRLFGTYARTLFGAMLRIAIVVAACCALATPAILSLAFEESESPRGLWFSAGLAVGGKLKLPLIGPLLVPSKFGRFFDHGWFFLGQSHIFVTKGVGYFPGVFGSQGEIVKLRLVRSRQ